MINRLLIALLAVSVPFAALAENKKNNTEKNPEDPTKVVTKGGIGMSGDGDDTSVSLSGSLSLSPVRKINFHINDDVSEWRVGGSWLFDVGIINFNFSRSEYEDGFDNESYKNNYSVGTFIPLSVFGIEPAGWQIFPMAGYSYNDGEFAESDDVTAEANDYVMAPSSSHGAYLGAFTLKPLSQHWTMVAFGGGSMGSDDYSGYWVGAGVGYRLEKHHSMNMYALTADDDYGTKEKMGISYTYEFD